MSKTIDVIQEAKDELRTKIQKFVFSEVSKFEGENKVEIADFSISLERPTFEIIGDHEFNKKLIDVDVLVEIKL